LSIFATRHARHALDPATVRCKACEALGTMPRDIEDIGWGPRCTDIDGCTRRFADKVIAEIEVLEAARRAAEATAAQEAALDGDGPEDPPEPAEEPGEDEAGQSLRGTRTAAAPSAGESPLGAAVPTITREIAA
jgi:hypothetical protein